MFPYKIKEDFYYVGVNDRKTELFERIIPIPYGVSYNSYLLVDEKVVLFDTVEMSFADNAIEKIKIALNDKKIDYLIIHHLEPDHTSGIKIYLNEFPEMQIICSKRAKDMLDGFYGISDKIITVDDNSELSTGKHTLKFIYAPMVHWPEVMMSYETTEKILFSADAFGCFGTLDGRIFDNFIDPSIYDKYIEEMYRYYVNVVGKYGVPVQSTMKKFEGLQINMICSLHGPIWIDSRESIFKLYDRLSRYEGEKGVVILYGSMYSNTEKMAEVVARGAYEANAKVILHDVSKSDISFMITDCFRYSGLIIGSPTYNGTIFSKVQDILERLELRGLKNRTFGSFGSYTWGGIAVRQLNEFSEKMKWDTVGSVEVKQSMKISDYQNFYNLGRSVGEKVAGL
ncbi:MAG: FprA family A-type flavoprotein [Prevotellaceae bacterium]|jgi:flavorubredoxin|nr:FprA family A-type flavoprotein [Prevotellaceae bacterium]